MSETKTKQLFDLGQCCATPGAIQLMQDAWGDAWHVRMTLLFARHASGDWSDPGVLGNEDRKANDDAVRDGDRILSAYLVGPQKAKLWIITEAVGDDGKRASSCLLLSSEY